MWHHLYHILSVKVVTKIHLISREENKDLHFSMEKCHIVRQACGMGNTFFMVSFENTFCPVTLSNSRVKRAPLGFIFSFGCVAAHSAPDLLSIPSSVSPSTPRKGTTLSESQLFCGSFFWEEANKCKCHLNRALCYTHEPEDTDFSYALELCNWLWFSLHF